MRRKGGRKEGERGGKRGKEGERGRGRKRVWSYILWKMKGVREEEGGEEGGRGRRERGEEGEKGSLGFYIVKNEGT